MPENGRISGTSQGDLLLREKETRDFSPIQGKTVMRMTPEVKDASGREPTKAPLGARDLERVACRSLKPLIDSHLRATNQAKIGEGSHDAGLLDVEIQNSSASSSTRRVSSHPVATASGSLNRGSIIVTGSFIKKTPFDCSVVERWYRGVFPRGLVLRSCVQRSDVPALLVGEREATSTERGEAAVVAFGPTP